MAAAKVGKAKGGVALLDRKGTAKRPPGIPPAPVARSSVPPPSAPEPNPAGELRWKDKKPVQEKHAWQNTKRRGY